MDHRNPTHTRGGSDGTPGIVLTYSSQGDYPLWDLAAYDQGIFTYTEEKMMESVRTVLHYFNYN